MIKRLFKLALLLCCLLGALALLSRSVLVSHVDGLRPYVETLASRRLHAQLTVGKIAARWQGWTLSFIVDNVQIHNRAGVLALTVPQATASLSWRSLLRFTPIFLELQIDNPAVLAQRRADGTLEIAGVPVLHPHSHDHPFTRWLLSQERVAIHGGTLIWHDAVRSPPDLMLRHIELALNNRGNHGRLHHLSVQANGGGTWLRGPLEWQTRFQQSALADPGHYRTWQGQVYLKASALDLSVLSHYSDDLGLPLQSAAGQIGGDLTFDFSHLRLTALHANVTGTGLVLRLHPPLPPRKTGAWMQGAQIAFNHWSGEITTPLAIAHSLNLNPDNSADSVRAVPPGRLHTLAGTFTLTAQSGMIVLPSLLDQPTVTLAAVNGKLAWQVSSSGAAHTWFLHTNHLMLSNRDAAARIQATYRKAGARAGTLHLLAKFSRLAVPALPRYLSKRISPKLRAYLAHALRGGVFAPATLELAGTLDHFPFDRPGRPGVFRVIALVRHGRFNPSPLPVPVYISGHAADPARIWPTLEDIRGRCEIRRATNNSGLSFDFVSDHARYRHFQFTNVSGHISDLTKRADALQIDLYGAGPLDDGLSFIHASPLARATHYRLDPLSSAGTARLALHLTLPRIQPKQPLRVQGAVEFDNDTLYYPNVPPLTALHGMLRFSRATGNSATLEGVQGRFLGQTLHFSGGMNAARHHPLTVDISGNFDAAALKRIQRQRIRTQPGRRAVRSFGAASPLPGEIVAAALRGVRWLSGSAPYTVTVQALPHSGLGIHAMSKLMPLSIDLPAPLGKAAGTSMPLYLSLSLLPTAAGSVNDFTLRLGSLALKYVLHSSRALQNKVSVEKGAIGVGATALLPRRGVVLHANLPHFDVDAWRAVLADYAALMASSKPNLATHASVGIGPFLPTRFAVHAGTLQLAHRQWRNVTLSGSHNPTQWSANLQTGPAVGRLIWWLPRVAQPAGKLYARLTRLQIPAKYPAQLRPVHFEPPPSRVFPALDIAADDFTLMQRNLGSLQLRAHNEPVDTAQGSAWLWQLDRLNIHNPVATLNATGHWQPPIAQHSDTDSDRTRLEFQLTTTDSGALLQRLNFPGTLRNGAGTLIGQIDWAGDPADFVFDTLAGKASLDLQQGELMKVKPGIANLLDIFSVQDLVHFLMLDFHSLYRTDLPFDSVQATGDLQHGRLQIHRFALDGPLANITLRGSTDLGYRTHDLRIHVVPYASASTAALAVAAVDPVLGLGTWVAQWVISTSLSHALAEDYRVTGPWNKPLVEKLKQRSHTPVM